MGRQRVEAQGGGGATPPHFKCETSWNSIETLDFRDGLNGAKKSSS